MPGLNIFSTRDFAYRSIITKAAGYTVLVSDEFVQVNGAYTMTLPPLNSLSASTEKKKSYKFSNIHASADATIQPGTNTLTGVADTINNKALFTLKPNESIVIVGSETGTDWSIQSPYPQPNLTRVPFSTVVYQNAGTTTVNVFDANGAPANIDITAVMVIATGTHSGSVIIRNGTDTAFQIAKSTTAGAITANTNTGSNPSIAKGSALTVENTETASGAVIGADTIVVLFGTEQVYAG